MAEPDAAVTDTHPLIFHAAGSSHLGRRVDLRRDLRTFFDDLFSNPSYQPLDLTAEQVFVADDLALTHDPFDALIAGAAVTLGIPLITRDGRIQSSRAVRVVW